MAFLRYEFVSSILIVSYLRPIWKTRETRETVVPSVQSSKETSNSRCPFMNEPAPLRGNKSFELVKQNCCSKDDEARVPQQVYQWQFTVAAQLHQWKELCRVRRSIQILSTVKLLYASLAQLVEYLPSKQNVIGSRPIWRFYKAKVVPIIVSGFDSHHQDFLMRWNGDTRDLKSCTIYNRPILCKCSQSCLRNRHL